MSESKTILIAGGGTGGHVYPGIALADEMCRLRPDLNVEWVGTQDRIEARVVPRAGYTIHHLDVQFLKGRSGLGLIKAAFALPGAIFRAMGIVRALRPAAVVGLGGFVMGPVCVAGWLRRVPVFLLEQNAIPGITNRLSSKFARRVYPTFVESTAHFPRKKVGIVGNPIRRDLIEGFEAQRNTDAASSEPGRAAIRVLVFGGSQGARSLNDFLPSLLAALTREGVELEIRHVAGAGRGAEPAVHYNAEGVDARIDEYIDDMAEAYANCDVVICRAGATSISEVTALGLPAVYVPFPYAADDHQTANAKSVVDRGAGAMVTDAELEDGSALVTLRRVLSDRDGLAAMAAASAASGNRDAGPQIAADILSSVGAH